MAHVTSCEVSRSHTHTHTFTHTYRQRESRTPLDEWSARRRGRYLHNTHHSQQTNIHFLSGIRTRDPSSKAAADLRHRPHGYPDRPYTAQKLYFVSYNLAAHAYRSRTSASYYCSLGTLTETKLWLKVNLCVSKQNSLITKIPGEGFCKMARNKHNLRNAESKLTDTNL